MPVDIKTIPEARAKRLLYSPKSLLLKLRKYKRSKLTRMHKTFVVQLTALLVSVRISNGKSNHNPFIWKGTQWCGIGERKETDPSSVNMTKTDECCKQHDSCPHFIPRWNKRYNLFNWRLFTISSCACDDKFRACLQSDDSLSSKDIKSIYFGMLKIPCFEIELRETKTCVSRHWYLKCKEYQARMTPFAKIRS